MRSWDKVVVIVVIVVGGLGGFGSWLQHSDSRAAMDAAEACYAACASDECVADCTESWRQP